MANVSEILEYVPASLKVIEYVRSKLACACGDRIVQAAMWFAYSPDRKGEHPQSHLRNFSGTLQADAYAGFDQIYEAGRIQEAACWAQVILRK